MPEIAIVEEDMRNKTRMGRQSLRIEPQPEARFLREYRNKAQKQKLSQSGGHSWMLWEETEEKKSLSPEQTSLEVPTKAQVRKYSILLIY